MNKSLIQLSILCIALLITQPTLASTEKLIFTTGLKSPLVADKASEGFVESIAREVFRRIGVTLEVSVMPSKLALLNSNSGKSDGSILRIKGIDRAYKNLIRIPEVIMHTEFSAYSADKIDSITSWKDLDRHQVAYVNGWRIFENNVINNGNVRKADSPEMLFNILKDKKTEVVLYEKWQGIILAKKIGLNNIYANKLPMDKKEQFMYLNKKYQHLVAPAAKALKEMKSDGTYQRIFDHTLGHLVK